MTSFPAYNTNAERARGPAGRITGALRGAEAWLDRKGRGAWIAAMVAGFVVFWPVGLGLVAYMTITNRWSSTMFANRSCRSGKAHWSAMRAAQPSGNSAFDAYRAETLRRLEEEQEAFESFLRRLREAKDKSEFDAFMEERAKTVTPATESNRADA